MLATTAPPAAIQGVGVQLLDQQLINFPTNKLAPWQLEPDTYIGTANQGTRSDPIAAGSSRTYQVKISNTGNITETTRSFAAAASLTGSSWSVTYSGVNAASSWTAVPSAPVVLAPGASYTESVTVTVPAGTKAGSYDAVVWAGPQVQGAGNLKLAIYAGVREYITVK